MIENVDILLIINTIAFLFVKII